MSVAQSLPDIDKNFIQICPLCGQKNRMVLKGVRHNGTSREIYPDIGYSFCNCKSIFYTNFDNIWPINGDTFSDIKDPIDELKKIFKETKPGYRMAIKLPDPFFCEWGKDPHEFLHWNPRRFHIIWDKDQIIKEAKEVGFEVEECDREFGIGGENPQTFRLYLRKTVDKNDPLWKKLYLPETRLRAATQAAKDYFGDKKITMAEIGVLRGDYSALQLKEWPNIKKIHLIDMWAEVWDIPDKKEHSDNFKYVLKRFVGNVRVNVFAGDSVESAKNYADESMDYVYIDANHLYEPVKNDIHAWLPKVKKGGIIGGHDYDYAIRPSVKEAVHDIFGDKVQHGENQNTLHDWWVIV